MKYLSHIVEVGNLKIGGNLPIVIQSMTNTDTNDIKSTFKQCVDLYNAGCQIIRITTQGERELNSLAEIKRLLRAEKIYIPLVADVHYRARVAEKAASIVEKVRINPGNFLGFSSQKKSLSDKEFELEYERIYEKLQKLISISKKNNTAIRVGVNHGSLSNRIIERYGNTPEGMAESALEYAKIFYDSGFNNLFFSLKASDVNIMINSHKLLVNKFIEKSFTYPLHLGITEAGNEIDGIIKSSVGIGYLLKNNIGNTIRVSLTGNPLDEIPVAKAIVENCNTSKNDNSSSEIKIINDIAISDNKKNKIDVIVTDSNKSFLYENESSYKEFIIEAKNTSQSKILKSTNTTKDLLNLQVQSAIEIGEALIDDKNIKAVWLDACNFGKEEQSSILFSILQALKIRITKTEYIACPSCGRTLFDINEVLKNVKERTNHLKHLKIAVMGCIVNGPGEMHDADYGYIGSGAGKVNLYIKQEVVLKNIPENQAIDKLVEVIKLNGDWIEE